jgi:hypothetical protein
MHRDVRMPWAHAMLQGCANAAERMDARERLLHRDVRMPRSAWMRASGTPRAQPSASPRKSPVRESRRMSGERPDAPSQLTAAALRGRRDAAYEKPSGRKRV